MKRSDFCETCFVANVVSVMPGAHIKTPNAAAPQADGIDALFAALLQGTAAMPGEATMNNLLPPQADANVPQTNDAPANAPAKTAAPVLQIVQPVRSGALQPASMPQISAMQPVLQLPDTQQPDMQQPAMQQPDVQQASVQPRIEAQMLPADPIPVAPLAKNPAPQIPADNNAVQNPAPIAVAMAAPIIPVAQNDAPAPDAPKPKDKPKSDPVPQIAAVPVFVPVQQVVEPAKIQSGAIGDVTSKPAAPQVAQQALDHAQSAVIQTQAEAKAAPKSDAPPAKNEQPATQLSQNAPAPAKFDLSAHTGGENAQSDNRDQPQQPAPVQAASSAPAAPAVQPQTNPANNTAPAAPQATPVLAVAGMPHAPVQTNIAVHAAPQSSTPQAVPYDIGTMAVTIAAKSQDGDHYFDIRLDPPELGSIAVHLTVNHAGQAAAHLTADKPETLQLLQSDSGNLQSALKDAGLNLAGNGLNFSLRGDQRQAGQSFQRGTSRSRILSVSAAAAPTPTSAIASSYAPGALDITI